MIRVCVVCEGQTEETFVRNVLAPLFYECGLNLVGELIQTSVGHKGGALTYDRVKRHLRNTLNQSSQPVVTTLFDLYRLDMHFPGFAKASQESHLDRRLEILRNELHQDIVDEVGCRPDRFIPYIQPHEFEALLFSDVTVLTHHEQTWLSAAAQLQEVRDQVSTPEHINDRPETKPAAHLARFLKNPNFRKTLHGPAVAGKIGLAKIESECPFFHGWMDQLRALSSNP